MCGLTGFFARAGSSGDEMRAVARRMADTLTHRGPDDSGVWTDESAGVALAFRRLSIVDLSVEGHQPMRSGGGRFTMVFNGEVYNHRELARELAAKGYHFRGHSDSEVILAAFEEWGIERSVRRFVGMFAIAVWDSRRRELSLIRDRLGIKPLFVYHNRGVVSFGSEIKALLAGPEFDSTLDVGSLTSYLRYLYVPAPRSIYKHVFKLQPGHILTIAEPGARLPASTEFWSAEKAALAGHANLFAGDDTEAVAELERLLTDAVRLRMQADVPLGALLSGGVDSSTVVALMQRSADRPVKTFTIGFDRREFDEAQHARAIAGHLGTDHTELNLRGEDALAVIPRLPAMFDEPLADPSQIPTFLVSELARQQVTVALTGDGGDELFGGYNRYVLGERVIPEFQKYPLLLRRFSAAGVRTISPKAWNQVGDFFRPAFPVGPGTRLLGDRLYKVAELLGGGSSATMYRSLLSAWQDPQSLVLGGRETASPRTIRTDRLGLIDEMMLWDQQSYLADDLLAKVDRASMAVGLEARVPILDHRVVEFAWRLGRHHKVRDGRGKWILRQVLYKHVPRAMVDREKMGFSVPLTHWLTGPLRSWAGDMLSSASRGEFLQQSVVRREWNSFLQGKSSNAAGIWALVMFCAWQDQWLNPARNEVPRAVVS